MLKPISVTLIGKTLGREPRRMFGIRQSDRLFHQYVIGQTGVGKSSLLFSQMKQDIRNGQGFCVIDPHGDLANQLRPLLPSNAIYWDAADPENDYGYNPLTPVSAQYRPLVASALIDTLKKQWADAWGPRMEHLLRYSLLALLEYPSATIADIMPMYLEKDFQRRVVSCVTDPYVRRFWTSEFETMKYKGAVDGVAPIANKLGGFLAHPVVRQSVTKPKTPLRFRQLMDERRPLVINLAKGRLGADTANVLGGMVLSAMSYAAYSSQNIPEPERQPYFLYVDEFHSFTTLALADMLSELRKYKLGLVLAHQHTGQLDKDVLQAVMGNVGTLLAFRVGASDATILSKQLGNNVPSPSDLVNLPSYECYAKLMVDQAQ
ncbi:MAG: TraM recognition domain-containing protein, partial [Pseudomonadota bacterium]